MLKKVIVIFLINVFTPFCELFENVINIFKWFVCEMYWETLVSGFEQKQIHDVEH